MSTINPQDEKNLQEGEKMARFKSSLGHFLAVTLGKLTTLSELRVQNAGKDSTWLPGWVRFQARQGPQTV